MTSVAEMLYGQRGDMDHRCIRRYKDLEKSSRVISWFLDHIGIASTL